VTNEFDADARDGPASADQGIGEAPTRKVDEEVVDNVTRSVFDDIYSHNVASGGANSGRDGTERTWPIRDDNA
jgi:hypothetical protein